MMATLSLLSPDPVQWAWGVVLFWLALGFASLLLQGAQRLLTGLVFPLGALGALAIAGVGIAGLIGPATSIVLPIGLPDLPFHLRLDALSAFFMVLLGGAAFGVTVYASGISAAWPRARWRCWRCGTTSFWRAWSRCCWPTTPTPSWWPGR